MTSVIQLGRFGVAFCLRVGRSGLFLLGTLVQRPQWRQAWPLLSTQLYRVGILSLPIILLSALFIGMVVALQGYNTLQKFGAEQELGQLLALSIVRELGPVVSALLFAGRAGSALTAELGLMRATSQLSSLEMMAVNPLWYVVAPRFWAGFIALPLLTILFNVMAIYGGQLVGVDWLGVDGGSFWSNMQSAVNFHDDVLNGIIKSVVFGFMVTWVAVYQGYYSEPNARGISRATTKTVVYSSLLVLALDFVLTAVMMGGW
ncbi:MAG: ABC transporter permease [Gammaproteobacteria bacterium RIFCSPLOWO2_02_FULL_42_14]|nr:MAG: ABC transporter permease [Gammaproteobacteria bacterium RIFCSPHIGHO2_02_FULL_42_43]OGT51890.1 MAG: ABC transporter permease [Gammaproteobacteria bacterium RIFCSPHIGHO2_12_FULL_41_25]OGT62404.1 MAG: ABC transporter permease [Gammaproteobacteria bacterium RIFCSPLOWO2_02_FULL_42_14]OGT85356.1 MAG: ABC transporter permease [Gammaproteobacteria bacterium RIFCSPLOWO2_12_FULL_42_18]